MGIEALVEGTEQMLALLANGAAIHRAARGFQGQDADSQGGEGEFLALSAIACLGQCSRHLGVGHRQVQIQGLGD